MTSSHPREKTKTIDRFYLNRTSPNIPVQPGSSFGSSVGVDYNIVIAYSTTYILYNPYKLTSQGPPYSFSESLTRKAAQLIHPPLDSERVALFEDHKIYSKRHLGSCSTLIQEPVRKLTSVTCILGVGGTEAFPRLSTYSSTIDRLSSVPTAALPSCNVYVIVSTTPSVDSIIFTPISPRARRNYNNRELCWRPLSPFGGLLVPLDCTSKSGPTQITIPLCLCISLPNTFEKLTILNFH